MSAIGRLSVAERQEIRKLRGVGSGAHPKFVYKVTAKTNGTTAPFERRIVARDAIEAIHLLQKTWVWSCPVVTAVVLESDQCVWAA